ncbi:MAG: alpha/beta fold hydrolase [[Clostridium] symbiosum]
MDTGRKAGMMNRQLDEKIFIEVNGIRQGMFLQSENTENPVLLYLHGGPGSPEIAFTQDYPTGLEQLFTVCWWEQRGSGISYSRKVTKETMTIGQMIEDATAVTNYLRRRFGKEKIYVLGHSWGSVLGVLTVQKSPELFHGYIGIGQVVCQSKSECLAYSFMVNEFTAAGDRKMLRRLEKFPIDRGGEVSFQYLAVRSVGMMKLGIGIMHHLDSMSDCIKIVLRYKGYTL